MRICALISQWSTIKAIAYTIYAAAVPPQPGLVSSSCDFGETYQYQKAECLVELVNNDAKPIRLTHIKPVEPEDKVDRSVLEIPAHSRGYLNISVRPTDELGYTKRYVEFKTSDSSNGVRYAEAKGMVLSVLDDAKLAMNFEVVDMTARSLAAREVHLSSREIDKFKIQKIVSAPEYLDVEILPDGQTLRGTVKKSAPWGIHNSDAIKVAINTAAQQEVSIPVKADIHGEIVPDVNPYALGLMRKGGGNEFLIPLRSRSGKEFKIGSVKVSRVNAKASVADCIPAASGCRALKVNLSDTQVHSQIGGLIEVAFPEYANILSVYFWGMLVDKSTKVLDFEEEMKKQEGSVAAIEKTKSALAPGLSKSNVDISKAIKAEVSKENSLPQPSGRGPLLKWSVANQALIYGFVIYRSDARNGPFVKVNEKTILVASGNDDSSTYQWRDVSATPGVEYWYTIDVIRRNGMKQQLAGPQPAVAK